MASTPPKISPPRPGLSFALRFLLAGVIVLIVAGTAVATTIQGEADGITKTLREHSSVSDATRRALDDVESGKPQTILLVGDDHRFKTADGLPTPKNDPTRADTMILVRLDPDAHVTSMLSLPRDLLVSQQPGALATSKLNGSYAGGPEQLIDTLKRILSTPDEPFRINHYVSIRFTAFSQAVKTFGCFYVDIDRRYFIAPNSGHAEIDVPAGYQRLCGEKSLQYVRFRVQDSDVVREARQTHYLAEARGQIADSTILKKRDELLEAIADYIKTDIGTSSKRLLSVIKLAVDVAGKPTHAVKLQVSDTLQGDLKTTPEALAKAAHEFMNPRRPPDAKARAKKRRSTTGGKSKKKKSAPKIPATMLTNPQAARDVVARDLDPKTSRFPIYYPRLIHRQARYPENNSVAYDLQSPGGKAYPWQAYRIVAQLGGAGGGQNYGVQGVSWRDPPVLKLTTDEVRLGGKTFRIEYDGRKIRRLIWRAPQGTYWVTNSLNAGLSNDEMRAVARSLTRYK